MTPFGIIIEALMVTDANGNPSQLSKYFTDNGSLETSDKENK
jgi:hypothetical protein